MFDSINPGSFLLFIFAIAGWAVAALILAVYIDYRKQLCITLEGLRDNLNKARGLVEQQPDNVAAKATLERAQKLYDLIDNGLEMHRHPLVILRAIVSEVGIEMAIAARFQAGARK
jgi:hypothetical protein